MTKATKEHPVLETYNEAKERYDRFFTAHPELVGFERLIEDLNDATEAMDHAVRRGTLQHPDFTVKGQPYRKYNPEQLVAYVGEGNAIELGFITKEVVYKVNKEVVDQAFQDGLLTPEELDLFSTIVTSYNTPPTVIVR